MAGNLQRRQKSRHVLRWKAAVAFDPASGKPVVHTQTQDVSETGAAIFTDFADLTGATVTLLLAIPASKDKHAPRVLKMQARVLSTMRAPGMARYRHGLVFVRTRDDGVDELAAMLGRLPEPDPPTAPPPDLSTVSRLEWLRQRAQAKIAEELAKPPEVPPAARIDEALRRAYAYLHDLAAQLNVVKPAFPKAYGIAGVPEFKGLAWETGHANFHTRTVGYQTKYYERVIFQFLLSGGKPIRVAREVPASDRLKNLLVDCKIDFTLQEVRNARGFVDRINFEFPCKVAASILLSAEPEAGKIMLHASNVSGYGTVQQVLAPEAIDDASLNELSGFILGEAKVLGPLLLRGA